MDAPRPTRRSVLVAVAAVVPAGLAGCTSAGPGVAATTGSAPFAPAATPDTTPSPSADELLTERVVADVRRLGRRYAAAGAAVPSLRRRLAPLADEVDRHLDALGARPATPAPSPGAAAGTVAATTVLRRLRTAARTAAERRLADSTAAQDPQLARLLASVGGSNLTHAVVLGRWAALAGTAGDGSVR